MQNLRRSKKNSWPHPVIAGGKLYLRDQDLYTLPLGLRQLQQLDPTGWPLMMAGAVMLTLPAVLFFFLVGRLLLGERGLGRH